MGRGLSDIQKRILAYAFEEQGFAPAVEDDGQFPRRWDAPWPPHDLIPGKPHDEWTAANRAAVSRALARLEQRDLINRISHHDDPRANNRTIRIRLTLHGAEVHRSVVAATARKGAIARKRWFKALLELAAIEQQIYQQIAEDDRLNDPRYKQKQAGTLAACLKHEAEKSIDDTLDERVITWASEFHPVDELRERLVELKAAGLYAEIVAEACGVGQSQES
jgi:DNA-binding MarR family transcriptional regulator